MLALRPECNLPSEVCTSPSGGFAATNSGRWTSLKRRALSANLANSPPASRRLNDDAELLTLAAVGPGNKHVLVTGGLEVAQSWQMKSTGAADCNLL
jgi:hypothetical protein